MIKFSTLLLLCFCFSINLSGQTNPAFQALPYSQNFGAATFTSMPVGTASWNGLSGAVINTQALAEASVPTGNATVTAATTSQTVGGTYGYATAANGRLYIQSGPSVTDGVNQLVIGVSTGIYRGLLITYSIEMINNGSGNRTIGSVLQYRAGTSGAWTTIPGSAVVYTNTSSNGGDADIPGDIDTYNVSVSGLTMATDYQLRWAHWRGGTAGGTSSLGIAYDNISITGGFALPVNFGPVQAISKQNAIQINWTNLTESEIEKYEIEHSPNGRQFNTVGFINAKANNGTIVDYTWVDLTPGNGVDFYRIKAVGMNGAIIYSSIIKINTNKTNSDLFIHPNPVKGATLSLHLLNLRFGSYLLSVYNKSGQEVYKEQLKHNEGSINLLIQLPAGMQRGIYHLQVKTDKLVLQKSFLLQ